MFVRLTKPFKFHPAARVLDVTPGVADVLVNRRRVAELVKKKKK